MMIRYSNGRAVEAVLLARSQKAMRVAIRGCEDVAELSEVNGTWVTEDGKPVQVEYEWGCRAGRRCSPWTTASARRNWRRVCSDAFLWRHRP